MIDEIKLYSSFSSKKIIFCCFIVFIFVEGFLCGFSLIFADIFIKIFGVYLKWKLSLTLKLILILNKNMLLKNLKFKKKNVFDFYHAKIVSLVLIYDVWIFLRRLVVFRFQNVIISDSHLRRLKMMVVNGNFSWYKWILWKNVWSLNC